MRHRTAGQKRLGISIIQCIWHDELIGLSTNSQKLHFHPACCENCHRRTMVPSKERSLLNRSSADEATESLPSGSRFTLLSKLQGTMEQRMIAKRPPAAPVHARFDKPDKLESWKAFRNGGIYIRTSDKVCVFVGPFTDV
jgi:hypothetical protein